MKKSLSILLSACLLLIALVLLNFRLFSSKELSSLNIIEDDEIQYLIITTSLSEYDSQVFVRTFDKDGNDLSEYKTNIPNAWDTDFTNGIIGITGGKSLLLFDFNNKRTSTIEASSSIEDYYYLDDYLAFTINNGITKGETEYRSNVCLVQYNESIEYTENDYSCNEISNFAPYDILLQENKILLVGLEFDSRKEYLLEFDYNLNLINRVFLNTSGAYFLSNDKENLLIYNTESYYDIETEMNYKSTSIEETDIFTFVRKYRDGFLRTNYSSVGRSIYYEEIENENVHSTLILSSEKNRISVISTNDTDVASILTEDEKSECVIFYDVINNEELPFKYTVDESELVIGAYYFKNKE